MRKLFVGMVIVTLVASGSGCTMRLIDFTVISSKNVQVPKANSQRVEGKDCGAWLLTIPVSTPNMKEAVDKAIESAGGDYDALVDGVLYSEMFTIVIFSQFCYRIEGTPINTKAKTSMNELEGKNVMYHSKRSNPTSRH